MKRAMTTIFSDNAWRWSIGLGVGVPVLGYLGRGVPISAADIISLILIIVIMTLGLRGIFYLLTKYG